MIFVLFFLTIYAFTFDDFQDFSEKISSKYEAKVELRILKQNGLFYALKYSFFEKEMKIRQHLGNSKFIVPVEGIFRVKRSNVFVMPYSGKDFRKLSPEKSDISFLMAQVILAIEHVHSRNVVHRDIHPGNILLGEDGITVKLIDFGESKILNEQGYATTERALFLYDRLPYRAPEIHLKDSRYDRKNYFFYHFDLESADIYSVGSTLFKLVAGLTVGEMRNNFRLNFCEDHQQIENMHMIFPYFDEDARNLIWLMICPEPQQRISIEMIKLHPYFKYVDWYLLASGSIKNAYDQYSLQNNRRKRTEWELFSGESIERAYNQYSLNFLSSMTRKRKSDESESDSEAGASGGSNEAGPSHKHSKFSDFETRLLNAAYSTSNTGSALDNDLNLNTDSLKDTGLEPNTEYRMLPSKAELPVDTELRLELPVNTRFSSNSVDTELRL